jgi:uncharacterized membrane protein YgcG
MLLEFWAQGRLVKVSHIADNGYHLSIMGFATQSAFALGCTVMSQWKAPLCTMQCTMPHYPTSSLYTHPACQRSLHIDSAPVCHPGLDPVTHHQVQLCQQIHRANTTNLPWRQNSTTGKPWKAIMCKFPQRPFTQTHVLQPLQELQVPKSLHGPIINDGWFSRGAAWNAAEDIVVYVAEQRPSEQTPAFGSNGKAAGSNGSSGGNSGSNGGSSGGKAAAPRTWKGVAAAVEDWGELNTGQSRGVGGPP